jgi:hypothetical protein
MSKDMLGNITSAPRRHQAMRGTCSQMRQSMEGLENLLPVYFQDERPLGAFGHITEQLMALHTCKSLKEEEVSAFLVDGHVSWFLVNLT